MMSVLNKLFILFFIFSVATAVGQGVGINVTSPQSMLDVEGNVAIGQNYSGSIAAPINGMIVEGEVGIGTSSTSGPLDVRGDAPVNLFADWTTEGNSIRNVLRLVRTYDGGTGADGIGVRMAFQVETETEGTNEIVGYIVADATDATAGTVDSDLAFWNTLDGVSYERMTIQSDGFVGIGTTAPSNLLEIHDNVSPTFVINTTAAGQWSTIRLDEQGEKRWWIGKNYSAESGSNEGSEFRLLGWEDDDATYWDALVIERNTRNFLIGDGGIGEGGNVGIKDDGPDALLEVSASGGATDFFMLSSDDANDGDIMVVKNSGNVGIGTTVPEKILHTSGGSVLFERSKGSDGNSKLGVVRMRRSFDSGTGADGIGGIVYFEAETETEGTIADIASISAAFSDATAGTEDGYLDFSTMTAGTLTDYMRLDENGNLGVGTTTIDAKLELQTSSGNVDVDLTSSNWSWRLRSNEGNNDFAIINNTSSITPFKIDELAPNALMGLDADGVGIGTNDPVTNLHVTSNATGATQIRIDNTDTGGRTYGINSTGSTGTGGAGLFKIVDIDAAADRLTINANGNVGIGTVGPGFKFHITDTGKDAEFLINCDANATYDAVIRFAETTTGSHGASLRFDESANQIQFRRHNGDIAGTTVFYYNRNDDNVTFNGGVVIGSPTGGNKGAGTLNATAVYDDNVLLGPDYVFDLYYDGKVQEKDKNIIGDFKLIPLEETIEFMEKHHHLPTMIGRKEWEKTGKPSIGSLSMQLWETVEVQALYIKELKESLDMVTKELEKQKKEIEKLKNN